MSADVTKETPAIGAEAELVLDNTTLLEAARALDREADVLEDHNIEDLDAAPTLRDAAERLRAVANAANRGAPRQAAPGFSWPAITVVVQGVADESMWPTKERA